MSYAKGYDKRYCDDFQTSLNFDKIDSIWKYFRQAGNSIEGRISKMNFKKIMNKQSFKNDKFLDKLFDRFKLDKYYELKAQRQQIDLQDFVIGLAILSRISFIDKVKFIFYLTDLDEDGCLSLQQIENMVERIEKIFCKENSSAKVDSYSLLFDLAHNKAQRNYREMLVLLRRNNRELKNFEGELITSDQFIQALKLSNDLYNQQKFIPLNFSLFEIINNLAGQPPIRISEQNKDDFIKFRKEIYGIFQHTKSQKEDNHLIKYPGKIEIIKENKIMETLPAVEKIHQKKSSKPSNKLNKANTYGRGYDNRDHNQQKNAQQNIQIYKQKVKKMIQTKEDPRLNIKFDQLLKK